LGCLLEVGHVSSTEAFTAAYSSLIAHNQSLNNSAIFFNSEVGSLKAERRKLDSEFMKLKLSVARYEQGMLLQIKDSDRFEDISDQRVLQHYRMKSTRLKLKVRTT
jgi:hypothetical protein